MTEQGRTDRAVWEGQMFRLLAENVQDYALFIVDPQRHVLSWSKGAERLLGFSTAEIVGQKCDCFFTPEDVREGVPQREQDEALATGRSDNDRWHVRKDGSRFWSSGLVTPLRDPGGTLRGFAKIMRDHTDLKRAEDAARERERQLQLVADHAPVLIAHCGADLRYRFVNKPFAQRFDLHPRDIIGRTIPDVLGPAVFALIRPHVEAALAGQRVEFEADLPYDARSMQTMRVAYEPEFDTSGRVVGFVAAILNISDRKRAEEQLRERAEEVEKLFDVLPVGVWLSRDRECRQVLGNRAGYAMLRMPEGTNLSKTAPAGEQPTHFRIYRAGREIPPEELPLQYAATHGVEVHGVEEDLVFEDGTVAHVYGSASPLFDDRGAVRGAVAGFLDVSALRRAEIALRESEERLRTLSDNLPLGAVYQVQGDPDGHRRFAYISAGVERLLGVTPAEAMADATALYGLVHEEDRPRVAAQEEAALRDLTPFDCEFRSWTRSGGLLWVHARSAPRPLPTGQVVWEGILMDVTARKRAEEERAKFTFLVENSTDFIGICDLDYRPFYVNRAGLRMVGLDSLEQARHVRVQDCFYSEEQAFVTDEFFPRVLRDGHGEIEIRFRHFRTGEAVWVVYSALTLRDENGQPTGLATISRDITERKRAAAASAKRSEQVRRLAEVATRINAAHDMGSVMRLVTEEARLLIGSHQSVAGFTVDQNWAQAINAVSLSDKYARWRGYDERPDGSGIYAVVCRTNKPMRLTQVELEAHPAWRGFSGEAGKHPPMRGWLAAPLVGRDGRNLGLIQLSDKYEGDFTEDDEAVLVQLAQMASVAVEKARLVESLQDADRRKDEFLATLAHELRNPLAPLRNGLEVLRLARGNPEAVERAQGMMERQLGHMVRLIDDLLDVSRITRGKLQLRRELVGLADVVQSAVEGCRPLIEASGHALTIALPPEPVRLDADPARLAQVFANLLTNAAKYTDKGGHIWLTAERRGQEAVVTVRDTGIGIAAEHLPRLFEIFSQVDPVLERSQGGLGIGLSLVKGLVEMHGGTVEARSDGPGKGSEFVVRLPVAGVRPQGEPGQPGHEEPTAPVSRRRVLVVDDNDDAAEALGMMLRMIGHEVRTAHDGLEGVEAAESFRPHVVLLDLGMPRLNGYEACRRIREQEGGKEVFVVALTGWGQEEDRRRTREAGFNEHFVKPVDPATLVKLLERLKTP